MFVGMMKLFFYVLGSHFYQFGFFMVKVQIWKKIFGCYYLKHFLGIPDIPDTFGDRE